MLNVAKHWHKVECIKCDGEFKVQLWKIRAWFQDGYVCFPCANKGKDEVQEAVLNLAKRKLAIHNKSK